ncbi:hypothetical protein DI09_37p10 [Mitosporidium daphniae]|uniref:Protein kinase domain-containing protein n=1 Tax=Mitosporidium daphniae TaxID=1485682 RepID=A0A098VRG8_9MICR|nr:uncharacterized protein DI09_37p10 [Mitosporidium daphniae]KGG51364.1 hypothetical protein DI09_37p10 [Mitosporidium daphniae]|eukprot:XP_013237812.1 uncharacterized protein DI09_37p10 [Mitosporidium daphniae]
MIDLDRFERNQIDELRKEIQVMSLCRHPNLLPILTTFVHKTKLWIVTPFLSGGSCLDIIKGYFPTGFEEYAIATILKQALQGLAYLHKSGHIHRDVKAGNLLIDKHDGTVKLADFGVSSSFLEDGERQGIRKTFVGTPCWMAPETEGYNSKADIWSFGITALELALGSAPFSKYPPMKVIYMTLTNQPPSLDRSKTKHKYSKSFKDMIDSCLVKDPLKRFVSSVKIYFFNSNGSQILTQNRPTAEVLLKHSFFKLAKKNSYLSSEILNSIPSVNERNTSGQRKNAEYTTLDIQNALDEDHLALQSHISINSSDREVATGQSWDFRSEIEDFANDDNSGQYFSDSESLIGRDGCAQAPNPYPSSQLSLPIPLTHPCSLSLREYILLESTDPSFDETSASAPSRNSEIKKGRFSILEAAASSCSLSPTSSANINFSVKSVPVESDSFGTEELRTLLSDSNIAYGNNEASDSINSSSSSTESTLFSKDDDRKLRQDGGIDGSSKSRFTKVNEGSNDSESPQTTITSVEELVVLIKGTLNISSDTELQNLRSIISRKNISISTKDFEKDCDQSEDSRVCNDINKSLFIKLKTVRDQLSLFIKELDNQEAGHEINLNIKVSKLIGLALRVKTLKLFIAISDASLRQAEK